MVCLQYVCCSILMTIITNKCVYKKVCTFCFCHTFVLLNLMVWYTWATLHVHTIPHPFSQKDFLLPFLLWCSSMNQCQEWFILPCILNNMCFPVMWCRLMAPFMTLIQVFELSASGFTRKCLQEVMVYSQKCLEHWLLWMALAFQIILHKPKL